MSGYYSAMNECIVFHPINCDSSTQTYICQKKTKCVVFIVISNLLVEHILNIDNNDHQFLLKNVLPKYVALWCSLQNPYFTNQ